MPPLIETTISDTTVHMRYADNLDPEKAKEWVDFQVPLTGLELPLEPLGDIAERQFRLIQAAALRRVRELIDAEIAPRLNP